MNRNKNKQNRNSKILKKLINWKNKNKKRRIKEQKK